MQRGKAREVQAIGALRVSRRAVKQPRRAEVFTRQARGRWELRETDSIDDTLDLASIGCELALQEIYRLVLS